MLLEATHLQAMMDAMFKPSDQFAELEKEQADARDANTSQDTLTSLHPGRSSNALKSSASNDTVNGSDIEAQKEKAALPAKQQHVLVRKIRHTLWAVYQRLFTITFLANLGVFIWFVHEKSETLDLGSLSTAAIPIAVNLFVSLLFRTEYWINFLYSLVIHVPHRLPLMIRRRLAKVYEFGGVHSGSGAATAVWALFFVVQITRAYFKGVPNVGVAPLVFTYLLVCLLVAIIIAAIPTIRRAQHNYFEMIHRFCGWAALALFWVLGMLLSHGAALTLDRSMASVVFTSPIVYFLLAATLLTVLPWLRLRKLDGYVERLSDHAMRLYLPEPNMGPVEGVRVSTNPLFEWHSFAAIPCNSSISRSVPKELLPTAVTAKAMSMKREPKYSILISKAGDWTSANIAGASGPRQYWIRGASVRGVALVVQLFRRAVVVTTGSGIGPALSMLAGSVDHVPCRLVWSVKDPERTYGAGVLAEVRAADPDAVIWDTKRHGRPDMVELTWRAYHDFGAEAIVCISNPKLTAEVVYGLESRGIAAYGPIFDS